MCDTIGKIIPGKGGFFGKNSDRSPNEPQVVEYYPAQVHNTAKVKTTYIEVDQVEKTKAIVLSRPTWMWGGEMGVNECGVCIGNEAVFTKGAYGKDGLTGILYQHMVYIRDHNLIFVLFHRCSFLIVF